MSNQNNKLINNFTIDVEEYHDRIAFKKIFKNKEVNKEHFITSMKILQSLLNESNTKATFFFLGKVAEKYPEIVKELYDSGHEIASHGYSHKTLSELTPITFTNEIKKTAKIIKKITGENPKGFRAPKFSLNKKTIWALTVLEKEGYLYDSSIYPFKMIGFGYGEHSAPQKPYKINNKTFLPDDNSKLWEYPLLTGNFLGQNTPIKPRHMGSLLTSQAIKQLNKQGAPATFLVHSWELVPLPKEAKHNSLKPKDVIRNYNLPCTKTIKQLLKKHSFGTIKNNIS